MKTCFKCHIEKPLDAFYPHNRMADGRLNKCKDCARRDVRKARIADPEKVRAYDRARSSDPARYARNRERVAQYRHEHPERYAAHSAVNNAIRGGKLEKGPCAFCARDDRVEAHHHDYSKPLDVTWLCSPCHRRFHALEQMATYDPATIHNSDLTSEARQAA